MAGHSKTPQQVAFGAWLKARRMDLDMTSQQAAQAAGVDPTTWRSYEAPGEPPRMPSAKTVKAIARALESTPAEVAQRAGVRLPSVLAEEDGGVRAIVSGSASLDILGDILVALKEFGGQFEEVRERLDAVEAAFQRPPRRRRASS